MNCVGQQIITQVELLPILLERIRIGNRATNRRIIFYVDNEPARETMIKGTLPSRLSALIAAEFYACELGSPSYLWFSRVPSKSNVADAPTRGGTDELVRTLKAELVEAPAIPASLVGLSPAGWEGNATGLQRG